MQTRFRASARRGARLLSIMLAGACTGAALLSCGGGDDDDKSPATPPAPAALSAFSATNVVADSAAAAAHVDPNLVNGWGIAFNPTGFVWVANQGSATSTLYDGRGNPQTLVVSVPAGAGGSAGPAGIVYNGTQDFRVSAGAAGGVAAFIFAGTGGTLSGWSPAVDRTHAITTVDTAAGGAGATAAAYTGLALAGYKGINYLYAADFRNGRIDVYDPAWKKTVLPGGAFTDSALPAGYAPYGIQAIGNQLYVTYAQHAAGGPGASRAAGLGLVNVFDPGGALVKRFATGGVLNAPWGIALAPANFGSAAGKLLVGNFGDGRINVFDPASGALVGVLAKADKTPIAIDGLWGIAFGNGINEQPANTLFYAAGPANETHGAYGRIDPQ
jgi:uncharacterized protein (TIGR03118 family)